MLNEVEIVVNSNFTYIKYKCHVKVLGLPEFKGCVGKYRG